MCLFVCLCQCVFTGVGVGGGGIGGVGGGVDEDFGDHHGGLTGVGVGGGGGDDDVNSNCTVDCTGSSQLATQLQLVTGNALKRCRKKQARVSPSHHEHYKCPVSRSEYIRPHPGQMRMKEGK